MSAAAGGLGVVGGLFQGIGARKSNKKQNQMLSDASHYYDPQSVNLRAAQLNPELFAALQGQGGNTGYQQFLANLVRNPGYIDPALMNAPYLQSAQRQQSDLAAAQGMLGRNQIGGGTGLGSAYALANQGARTARDTGLGQQYALWRAQQGRQDVDWLMGQRANAQQAAMGGINGSVGLLSQRQAPQSYWTTAGNAIAGGLGAYGAMKGLNQQDNSAPAGGGFNWNGWQGPSFNNSPGFSQWGPYGGGSNK